MTYVFDRTLVPKEDLNKHGNPNWFTGWEQLEQFATEKYELTKLLTQGKGEFGPIIIAEFGVRYGYGTHGIIKAVSKNVRYTGYDRDDCEPTCSRLRHRFPWASISFVRADVQKLGPQFLGTGNFADLIHIDATIGYEDTFRDLETAFATLKTGGQMVVNNYTFEFRRSGVRKAVDDFVSEHDANILEHALHKTLRGDYVISKR